MPDLTTRDIAQHYQLHIQTVQRYLRDGKFPNAYRIGREHRIPDTDLQVLRATPETLLAPRNNRSRAQQKKTR